MATTKWVTVIIIAHETKFASALMTYFHDASSIPVAYKRTITRSAAKTHKQ